MSHPPPPFLPAVYKVGTKYIKVREGGKLESILLEWWKINKLVEMYMYVSENI